MTTKHNATKKEKTSTCRYLIFIGISSILVVGTLAISLFVIEFIKPQLAGNSDFVLPKYPSTVVLEICDTFEVDMTDSFCSQPSMQDANSFETMLYQNYPRDEASYINIVPKLTMLRSKPTLNCNNPITSDFGWALDNCPSPDRCSTDETTYTCSFTIDFSKQDIGLDVSFYQDSGIVSGYGVSRPSESAP